MFSDTRWTWILSRWVLDDLYPNQHASVEKAWVLN